MRTERRVIPGNASERRLSRVALMALGFLVASLVGLAALPALHDALHSHQGHGASIEPARHSAAAPHSGCHHGHGHDEEEHEAPANPHDERTCEVCVLILKARTATGLVASVVPSVAETPEPGEVARHPAAPPTLRVYVASTPARGPPASNG